MSKSVTKKLHDAGMHLEPERKVLDVVCGMEINASKTKLHAEYQGETYYFCSQTCRNHLVNDPEKYVG